MYIVRFKPSTVSNDGHIHETVRTVRVFAKERFDRVVHERLLDEKQHGSIDGQRRLFSMHVTAEQEC